MSSTRPRVSALFSLGQLVATPAALEAVPGARIAACLGMHLRGEWSFMCPADRRANVAAVKNGSRVFSAFPIQPDLPMTGNNRVWIITEADRSSTCVLLPEDY